MKVAAFVEDIKLFIHRPRIALPALLSELLQFGVLSGDTLNLDKTDTLILKGPTRPTWSSLYPFNWQTDSLRYLGVLITKHPSKFYKSNISPYLQKLELTLYTWKNFTLSYVGRANLITMVEFPRLLSLLHISKG